jgi:hypothetical protein
MTKSEQSDDCLQAYSLYCRLRLSDHIDRRELRNHIRNYEYDHLGQINKWIEMMDSKEMYLDGERDLIK